LRNITIAKKAGVDIITIVICHIVYISNIAASIIYRITQIVDGI
jgi:hypothetical protein